MTESRANRRRTANGKWEYIEQDEAEFVLMSWPEYSVEEVDNFIDSGLLNEQTICILRGIRHDGLQAYKAGDLKLMESHLRALHMACRAEGIRERMKTDATRGRKVKSGASAGHKATHGTAEAREATYAEMTNECRRIHRDNPKWGKTSIRQEAAEIFGVSVRTIQRNVDLDAILKNTK